METITAEALERSLAGLAAAASVDSGVHQPDSIAWKIGRETLSFAGAGRAALLQLAHPAVAYAIADHSNTRSDPRGRFERTFRHVFSMVFGDWERASASARSVHRIHQRIHGEIPLVAGRFRRGQRYAANDPESLTWVWATLVDTVLLVHTRFAGLSLADKRAYIAESSRFAALFGLGPQHLPATYEDFKFYFNKKLADGELVVTPPAREMAEYLFEPPSPWTAPIMRGYRALTAELLPRQLARDFGMELGPVQRRAVRSLIPVAGWAYQMLPPFIRHVPDYATAKSRVGRRVRRPGALSLWALMERGLGGREAA